MDFLEYVVRARFVEAVDTDRLLPSVGRPTLAPTYWPDYQPTQEDMRGWGDDRISEHRRAVMGRAKITPSSAAISRLDECMDWTSRLIQDKDERRCLWGYSWCIVADKPFSAWCRKKKIVRMTAYRKFDRAVSRVVSEFRKNSSIPTLADENRVLQIWPDFDIEPYMVAQTCGDASGKAA